MKIGQTVVATAEENKLDVGMHMKLNAHNMHIWGPK